MLNPTCTLYFHELKWSRTNWRSSSGPSTPGLLPFFFFFFSWATSPNYFTWRGDRARKHDWSVYNKSSNGYVQVCSLQGCSWAQLWVIVLSVKYQIIEMPPRFLLKTKLPLLINCPSAHTWCRTKQESIRLLKGLFSKNHSALLDWVCSPSLLLTSSVTDYWRLVCVWTTWSRPSDPTNPASLLPLLWRGGQPSRCSVWKTCDRFKSCCDAAVMETLFQLVVFVFQGARVVVSRSFADFTPQATFDIKVGTNENH